MTSRVWKWRKAIKQASALTATTRHVLGNLADYMDKEGSCFPSTKRQAEDTALSERAVCEHLKKAEAAGFLHKTRKYGGTKAWARHEYFAAFPPGIEGSDVKSPPCADGADPDAEGADADDNMALTEGQSNYHSELPVEAIDPDANDVEFNGDVIRLTASAYYGKLEQYRLPEPQFDSWLTDRDKWLAKLPRRDKRVTNWWNSTWKALEADLESLRKSAYYASLPEPEPEPEERPRVIVWG